jgi:hypothetical protein
MKYEFVCEDDGLFIIEAPMSIGPQTDECPVCHKRGVRIYGTAPPVYHVDGFHTTDYTSFGHKQDMLRKNYELETGEKAPPPDSNRNAKRD